MEHQRLCARCGIDRDLPSKKSKNEICRGCRVKVEHVIRYSDKTCLAWRGDFDRDDNPIHNGQKFMAGNRSCGHKDCINPEHIN